RAAPRPPGDAPALLPQADAAPGPLRDGARLAGADRRRAPGLRPRDRDLPRRPLMRIGIYAPNMATPAPSGVERYIAELLRALAQEAPAHELALLTDAADLPVPEGGRRIPLKSMNRGARLWFDHCRLARGARDEKLDLLHCTKSFVPSNLDCPSVSTVYDVIFLKRAELYPFWWRAYWTRALKASMGRATAVVTISESAARDVEALLPAAKGK